MEQLTIQTILNAPLLFLDSLFVSIKNIFFNLVHFFTPVYNFFIDPHTWSVLGVISNFLVIIFFGLIIFSLIRLFEIQASEKKEIDHEIHEAFLRQQEVDRNANPRWHYIQTLIESPNESDWRVAIIEADSLLEESLQEKGLSGNTVSELLESAKESGYRSIQDAWDAHLVRNQIAHEGSDYPISQVEGRRVIKMFQNFFEEIRVV